MSRDCGALSFLSCKILIRSCEERSILSYLLQVFELDSKDGFIVTDSHGY